jgi:hypothetical protein
VKHTSPFRSRPDLLLLAGNDQWGGALFLGGVGVGFAAVYLRDQHRWWALIPAGVLMTLSVQAGLTEGGRAEPLQGALFFAGLALTFALVAVLPGGPGHRGWAWIPAAVLAGLAVLSALEATALLGVSNYAWPLTLIVAGGVLLWRTIGRGRGPSTDRNPAPGPRAHRRTRAAESHSRKEPS